MWMSKAQKQLKIWFPCEGILSDGIIVDQELFIIDNFSSILYSDENYPTCAIYSTSNNKSMRWTGDVNEKLTDDFFYGQKMPNLQYFIFVSHIMVVPHPNSLSSTHIILYDQPIDCFSPIIIHYVLQQLLRFLTLVIEVFCVMLKGTPCHRIIFLVYPDTWYASLMYIL